jgi:hypothetical protein
MAETQAEPPAAPGRQGRARRALTVGRLVFLLLAVGVLFKLSESSSAQAHRQEQTAMPSASSQAAKLVGQGRQVFRFDTFGDQAWWGGELQLHKAIEGGELGGVGPGLSPNAALALGLKVDVDALPDAVKQALQQGTIDLNDPAVTLALFKLNAVVGLTGFFDSSGSLTSVGIQCALCHSTVDNSFAPGIGHRLDGWAARA